MGKAGWLPVVILFIAVLWFGSKLSPGSEPSPSAANLPTSSAASPTEQSRPRRNRSHAPVEHHVVADQTIALNAVLHPEDVENGSWHSTDPPKKNVCPTNNPDLSSLALTAMADTAYTTANRTGWTESIVRLFPDSGQAAKYFGAVNNRRELACIRDGFERFLEQAGAHPRLVYARLQSRPALGEQTAVYLIGFELTFDDGAKDGYPVELLRFRRGRAVASLSYTGVYSPDGSRPCTCELDDARAVYERLAAA